MREKRKKLGLTQEKLAEELDINASTYRRIEAGESFPKDEKLLINIMNKLKTNNINIFEDFKDNKGGATNNICEYMNVFGNKKYSIDHVRAIRKAIIQEREDRYSKKVYIRLNKMGRKEINRRAAQIVNKEFSDINSDDIELFKRCTRNEFEDRTGKCAWGFPEVRERLGFNQTTGEEL